jgi:hypothetical protein
MKTGRIAGGSAWGDAVRRFVDDLQASRGDE